ncbi:MAG TPA: hypothetical protein VLG47_02940 [Candidatus Saccharimonadales bacterium]|nr:hypothetical protein [Candidatus Saccharimonadales bacterium]
MYEVVQWPVDSSIPPLPDYYALSELSPAVDVRRSDELMAQLPKSNLSDEDDTLRAGYEWHLGEAEKALSDGLSPAHAAALLGRLDMYIGPLILHGARDVAEQDSAQIILPRLGEQAGTVPCGTIYTYIATRGNFTGSDQERRFRSQVERLTKIMDLGSFPLLKAVENLDTPKGEFDWGRLTLNLYAATRRMEMLTVIANTTRHVPQWGYLEYFMKNIQPNFQPVTIGGQSYNRASGAHGAQLPFGNMVYGNEPDYPSADYESDSKYLTPNHRALIDTFWDMTDGRDILSLARNSELPLVFSTALSTFLLSVHKWRTGHKVLADDAEKLRGTPPSGAHGADKLGEIKELNLRVATELKTLGAGY